MNPTEIGSEFIKLAPIFPIALRNQDPDPLEVYYTTEAAEWQAIGLSGRRHAAGYLIADSGGTPLWRGNDPRVILPTSSGGKKFLGAGSLVAKLGMGDLAGIVRGIPSQHGLGRGSAQALAPLGYGYLQTPGYDPVTVPNREAVVKSANQTLTVQQFINGGGQLGRLILTLPALGISNLDLMVGINYGSSLQNAEFWFERDFAADFFMHNPTQSGCIMKPDDSPLVASLGSPTLASSMRQRGIELVLEGLSVPLNFNNGPNGEAGPNSDHGGSDLEPILWHRCLQGSRYVFNWQQREGVHYQECYYFAPFECRNRVGYEWNCITTTAAVQVDLYDKAYTFNAETNVATQMDDVRWGNSFFPNWYRFTTDVAFTTEEVFDFTGVPVRTYFNQVPSLAPRGLATILRATGTHYGSNTDLAIGFYTPIHQDNRQGNRLTMGQAINARSNQPANPPYLQNTGQNWTCQGNGWGRPAGWLSFKMWVVIDSFDNVKTKIRQLWLDGYRSSDLGVPFDQGYGSSGDSELPPLQVTPPV